MIYEWHLSETPPSQVHDAFDESYRILSEGQQVSRPLNSNTIILDYGGRERSERKERASFFAEYTPGRIFSFFERGDDAAIVLPKDLTLHDSLVSGGVVVKGADGRGRFSDVVYGKMEIFEPAALLSFVRAQLQVGFRPTVVLLGTPLGNGVVESLLDDASALIFSSESCRQSFSLMEAITASDIDLVDIEWLNISGWRAQLRNVSMKFDLSHADRVIDEVSVVTSGTASGGISSAGALFLGWIITQLQSKVRSLSHRGIECVSHTGDLWILKHAIDSQHSVGGVQEVQIEFRTNQDDQHDCPERVRITLDKESQFETEIEQQGKHFHFTDRRGEYTWEDDLERYFARGESILTYREALMLGSEVQQLLMTLPQSFS